MAKIQQLSCYLLFVFNALLMLFPLLVVSEWLFIDTNAMKYLLDQGFFQSPISTPEGYINLSNVQWTFLSKMIGFIAHSLWLLPLFLSLFVLKSIFHNYQNGAIFSVDNARHYSYLGGLFFVDALLAQPLGNLLMVLAVTLGNPPGHRYITISFGTLNLEAVFCGMLVLVISWVMFEGSKLYDEQKLTV